ncbi:hypothetical protein MSAN_01815200 [Mycena sanguinolenta]|uniref:Uncharacterized protein n=1 Tax=Mycena sanguinolenta TaxID=230812 RepID=A0A8H7CSM7_9AGAR|nr:hypothetical protein MSAN_01815200 [Mycena sanguinolenta]
MTTIPREFSFPLELEREIFETTAALFPGLIPTLLRVCHRVHVWIEPLLYRVLAISPGSPHAPLLNLVESKTSLLKTAVRHLLIQGYYPAAEYRDLVTACLGAVNLSIDGDISIDILRALDKMRLRTLAFTIPEMFFTPDCGGFNRPLFMSVTHLDLYHGPGTEEHQFNWETWSGLASIAALTHLALSPPIAGGILPQVVVECQHLLVAIVSIYPWEQELAAPFAENLGIADVRVVVMVTNKPFDVEWEVGARGGDDYWVRAERFVNRKRAGELESNCYLLDETATSTNPP